MTGCHGSVMIGRRSGTHGGVPMQSLTQAELMVVVALAQGLTDAQIATALSLSRHTVRHQVESAMRRTSTRTRAALLATAIHRGEVSVATWPPVIANGHSPHHNSDLTEIGRLPDARRLGGRR